MKRFIGILLFQVVGIFGLHVVPSHAAECLHDVAGGPDLTPDGLILAQSDDLSLNDAYLCYLVRDGGEFETFAHLLPRCDLNQDGNILLDEVFAIYYHAQPPGQDDVVAAAACIEFLESEPNVYCPAGSYAHFKHGVDTLLSHYPEANIIIDGQGIEQLSAGSYSYTAMICHDNSFSAPGDPFAHLHSCYNSQTICGSPNADDPTICDQYQTYAGDLLVLFDNPLDVESVMNEYYGAVETYAATCDYFYTDFPYTTTIPGFHVVQQFEDWLIWEVTSAGRCTFYGCDCTGYIKAATNLALPGYVYEFEHTTTGDPAFCSSEYGFPS